MELRKYQEKKLKRKSERKENFKKKKRFKPKKFYIFIKTHLFVSPLYKREIEIDTSNSLLVLMTLVPSCLEVRMRERKDKLTPTIALI